MKKEIIYDILLLDVMVSLNTGGWQIIVNKRMCCEKKRMGRVFLESEDSKRFLPVHLDNPGYGMSQQNYWTYEYWQTIRPEDKDKSIEFLKEKILVEVSGRANMLNTMIESANQNLTTTI